MIDTPRALAALVERARAAEAVALDTEFVWERTYYPRLGVVQLGLGRDDVHLIDAVALDDLTPLGALLADPKPVKVLHDAVQDLTLLRRVTGASPVHVFDTQRAAGFVGLTATISLQELFEVTVGVSLPKGATRSNWVRRPLSDEQLDYAEDDVRYLLDARADLLRRAEAKGRLAWIEEEMRGYDDPVLYTEVDPLDQADRVRGRGLGALSPLQRAALRELAAWREREARRRDLPRRRVLEDEPLIEVARRLPERVEELRVKGLGDRERQRYGAALVEAVARARARPESERPARSSRHPDEDRLSVVTSLLQSVLAGRCMREDVDPVLVATKTELRALAEAGPGADPEAHPVLVGWRRDFAGQALLGVLAGRVRVELDGPAGWPRLAEG